MNKYLISADIEGITGVVNKEFSKEAGKFYPFACRYMAHDVNAVVQGILNADFDAEVVVRDAHGATATNIELERLHPKASLVQGWGAIQNVMAGLDQDFKGVFLVGYHAAGDNTKAVLGHTMHSLIHSVKVNNKPVNEAGLFALYAGFFDVPVVFISGDDHAVSEAKEQLGDIVGVEVKKSYGRGCIKSLSLEQSRIMLEKNAATAVQKIKQNDFEVAKVSTPITLEVKLYDAGVRISVLQNLAEILEFDAAYKIDCKEHTIAFDSGSVLTMFERLNMIMHLIYGISASG